MCVCVICDYLESYGRICTYCMCESVRVCECLYNISRSTLCICIQVFVLSVRLCVRVGVVFVQIRVLQMVMVNGSLHLSGCGWVICE